MDQAPHPEIDDAEQWMFEQINSLRQANGRQPLTWDLNLNEAADWFSASPYTGSHYDYLQNDINTRVSCFGFPQWATEVLARFKDDAHEGGEGAFNFWTVVSAAHREQLLRHDVAVMGIGHTKEPPNAPNDWVWVVDLGPQPVPLCNSVPTLPAAPLLRYPFEPWSTWEIAQGYNWWLNRDYDTCYQRYAFDFVRQDGRQEGQYVLAAADGVFVSWHEANGQLILAHPDDYYTIYFHLDRINEDLLRQPGTSAVAQGDVLGWIGSRGVWPEQPSHLSFALVHGQLDANHTIVVDEVPVPFASLCDQAFPANDSLPSQYTGLAVSSCNIAQTTVGRGLDYLHRQHRADGSWQGNVGITALDTLAFINHGYGLEMPDVYSATQYLLAHQDSTGMITNDVPHATYETSLAILVLKALQNVTPDAPYRQEVDSATNWLLDAQWDTGEGITENDWQWGGFGYGKTLRPDLSNTQFALLALDAAGVVKTHPAWARAIKFVSRCQNRPESNDGYSTSTDGGFIYQPGSSFIGDTISHGSMTGAGIWSLALGGVSIEDPRIVSATTWISTNYSIDGHAGMPDPTQSQYYYYLALSKALSMIRKTTVGEHRWYDELAAKLAELQKPDGYWQNPNSYAWENIPELATAYSILSLQTRELPPGAHLYMAVVLHSPADLHLYDPQGRHVGKNYETGGIDLEIPGAEYAWTESQAITITPPIAGTYFAAMVPTGEGDYQLDVQGVQNLRTVSSHSFTGTLTGTAGLQGSFLSVGAIEGALTILGTPPQPRPSLHAAPRELFVRTNPGTTAVATFSLAELDGIDAVQDVTFLLGDLRGTRGYTLPASSISVEPAGFDLPAGSTQSITVRVPLISTVPWDLYRGTLVIESGNAGARNVAIAVQVPRVQVYLPLVLKTR